jgi:hypothetical protein
MIVVVEHQNTCAARKSSLGGWGVGEGGKVLAISDYVAENVACARGKCDRSRITDLRKGWEGTAGE